MIIASIYCVPCSRATTKWCALSMLFSEHICLTVTVSYAYFLAEQIKFKTDIRSWHHSASQ